VLTYPAVDMKMGFSMPMMVSTMLFLVLVVIAVLLGPENQGNRFTADLEVVKVAPPPAT
jgi:SHS family lactate transporter-like MFS transporter